MRGKQLNIVGLCFLKLKSTPFCEHIIQQRSRRNASSSSLSQLTIGSGSLSAFLWCFTGKGQKGKELLTALYDQQIKLNDDKTGAMYKGAPRAPLISPYKGLSPSLIFTAFFCLISRTPVHMHTLSSWSFRCMDAILAHKAAPEVLIKYSAIHVVPRTGKSHLSMTAV